MNLEIGAAALSSQLPEAPPGVWGAGGGITESRRLVKWERRKTSAVQALKRPADSCAWFYSGRSQTLPVFTETLKCDLLFKPRVHPTCCWNCGEKKTKNKTTKIPEDFAVDVTV